MNEEECPHCERYKQRVELWRQEAYRLSERQWVGLTDEEMEELWENKGWYVTMFKAVEAKLKEKNV